MYDTKPVLLGVRYALLWYRNCLILQYSAYNKWRGVVGAGLAQGGLAWILRRHAVRRGRFPRSE